MFRWIALISALVFVVAMAGIILSSQPPIDPPQQQAAEDNQKEHGNQKSNKTLWDSWFPDAISIYTLFLVVFTALLVVVGAYQWKAFVRAEHIAAKTAQAAKESADAAKKSAEISERALIATQRAFVRVTNFPWLWRPDHDPARVGKYWYDITPIVENTGNTPTVGMKIAVDYALRDTPLPDDFDFPYRAVPGDTIIGAKQSIGANNAVILDEDLVAVQDGTKFFYIWGTITYHDVFEGTPIHTAEFCTQIGRILGNPLDPRDPNNPKGTTVEIGFRIYPKHSKMD